MEKVASYFGYIALVAMSVTFLWIMLDDKKWSRPRLVVGFLCGAFALGSLVLGSYIGPAFLNSDAVVWFTLISAMLFMASLVIIGYHMGVSKVNKQKSDNAKEALSHERISV